jgi:hypothetical protein
MTHFEHICCDILLFLFVGACCIAAFVYLCAVAKIFLDLIGRKNDINK